MRCYDHSDHEAIAICMGCGKALCKDCIELNNTDVVVCSEKCGSIVNDQLEMIRKIRKKTLTQNKVSGVFCIIAGIVFGLFGLFNIAKENFFCH
jgi:hypothetical protein